MLDANENELAIKQQASYNYQLHVREKETAEADNEILKIYICIALVIVLCLCVVILIIKNRSKNNLIALYAALRDVDKLKQIINEQVQKDKDNPGGAVITNKGDIIADANEEDSDASEESGEEEDECQQETAGQSLKTIPIGGKHIAAGDTESELRQQLKDNLMELYVSNKYLIELPSDIYNTSAYAKLRRYIETEKEIKEDDVLWS